MPSQDPLDRLFREAMAFRGVNIRIGSVKTTRRIVEEQLERARHIEIARLRAEHANLGGELHPDDRDSDLFALQQQVIHLLPKVFRGGFLITLWSVLERCTTDIAIWAGDRVGRPVSPKLFRSRPFFVAAELAMTQTVQLPAFPDQKVKEQLEQLGVLRNVLAHHDGRLNEFPPPLSGLNAEQLAALGLNVVRDYDFSYAVPTEQYLDENTELVVGYIHSLSERAFNALDPE
jgi:hypothetical protein